MIERWRLTVQHPRYQVSNLGNVRRLLQSRTLCRTKPLKPYEGRHGYLKVQLGGGGPRLYVHTLVAMAWLGPRPLGCHIDHVDFDKTNNAVSNLRYLNGAVNSVRWAGRRQGRNIWALTADEEMPEDFVPMTDAERADYDAWCETWNAGWNAGPTNEEVECW